MATDAIVILKTIRVINVDLFPTLQPYIWPVAIWIDNNTLAKPELVDVGTLAIGNARVVIKSEMGPGDTADIPASVGVLRRRSEDGLSIFRLILVVALWHENETPEDAMRAGFQAFSSELRAAVAENLFDLYAANSEQEKEIIAAIETRVRNRVASAIRDGLTAWEKARVLLGLLHLDQPGGSAVSQLRELVPTPITLPFRLPVSTGIEVDLEIQGELQVQPVPVELCQAQVDAVNDALATVDTIDVQIKSLQSELQHASPSEKPAIIAEIRRLRFEELPVAMATLQGARQALQACRVQTT